MLLYYKTSLSKCYLTYFIEIKVLTYKFGLLELIHGMDERLKLNAAMQYFCFRIAVLSTKIVFHSYFYWCGIFLWLLFLNIVNA
jgi:hypothetical protein